MAGHEDALLVFGGHAAPPGSSANVGLPDERTRLVSRINSLIQPQVWKAWALTVAALLACGGVLWSGIKIDRGSPEIVDPLGLKAGHVARYFTILMLTTATQLSLIILWYRTHSRKDFHGRYRAWIWSSLTWGVFLAANVTDAHRWATRQIMAGHSPLSAMLGDRLWLIPAIVLFWSTTRILLTDMARCAPSRWLLWATRVASAAGLSVLAFKLPGDVSAWARAGISMLWPTLLSASLLHHARYVIHVTNEVAPVKRRTSRWRPIVEQGRDEFWRLMPSRERVLGTLKPRQRGLGTLRFLTKSAKASCRLLLTGGKRAAQTGLQVVLRKPRPVATSEARRPSRSDAVITTSVPALRKEVTTVAPDAVRTAPAPHFSAGPRRKGRNAPAARS
jgi:hypothetical protein